MSPQQKAFAAVLEKIRFIRKIGATYDTVHVNACGLAGQLGITTDHVIHALKSFASLGYVRLTTWRNDAWREIDYREWLSDSFFSNPHDANYVRLHAA